ALPIWRLLQPVEDRGLQRLPELGIPAIGLPAALVLRPLQQVEEWVGLNDLQATLDQRPVVRRPSGRQLADRCGAVPLEPGRLLGSCLDRARERDLEGPLPERDLINGVALVGEVLLQQPVEPVDLPVQLLLRENHPPTQRLPLLAGDSHGIVQAVVRTEHACNALRGRCRSEVLGERVEYTGTLARQSGRQREVLQFRAGELVSRLPALVANATADPA